MILNTNKGFKKYLVEVICLLYILLFVYAAVSKLLDFENFQVQLGQSPLLSVFAVWVSWLVPFTELLTAVFLVLPKLRTLGLFTALSLMTMFSVYIFIILHFSDFVPCSCGGVLEKMSWNVHLAFNLIFIMLACIAVILRSHTGTISAVNLTPALTGKAMLLDVLLSTVVIIVLFLISEDSMHNKNPFIRRFPQHPVMFERSMDLKFNSYYFAGFSNNRIYLGNYTTPLKILSMDSRLQDRKIIKIVFDSKKLRFTMVKIKISAPDFYLMDGTVPAIFSGKTMDWKISKELKELPYFTLAEPIDSTTVMIRAGNGKDGSHTLGVYRANKSTATRYNSKLLQVQIDGIFDTDGMLLFSNKLKKMVYVYYYRNEFIVAGTNVALDYRGHTIDTITRAKIKVAYLKNSTIRKMSAPPLIVNAHAAISGNLLFVNSKTQGQFEDEKLWKRAFIIDVYDLNKNAYLMSFSVDKIENKKLLSLFVTDEHLYALMENELVVYKLRDIIKEK
ncbi:hypothetical protein KHA90_20490 [Flavobacterium psychroterrae]|uniref:Methylamine utilisation protein MauE domain-containing protein n=1 Tax=Flavobacterium psychroterrae TaxID=2133767 RepID=A0ABS5PGF8_9FLAO|nr:MauE/DoxX family redox-associated membrane protein [Flavobacterium psychroterrae]MBS7233398.1 hypothetical protein [Flavobacterium psychroterrae]